MENIHELILKRWSPVAFDPSPVDQEKIDQLFEAAKWAPSGRNAQPWRFLYASREMPEYTLYYDLLFEGNQVWAGTAPLFILPLAQVVSDYKDRPNRLALYETGMAVSNLLLQATHMGLFVHQMGGYDQEKAREVLHIPDQFEPTVIMAIGYKGDIRQLPVEMEERETKERTRKDLCEFVMQGKHR